MSTCPENESDHPGWQPTSASLRYIQGLETERDFLRIRIGKFAAACDRLADENGRLRRACRAKKAFELAIVCLMRRLPCNDACRVLAGKLIDRYGYASASRNAQLSVGSRRRRIALKKSRPDEET